MESPHTVSEEAFRALTHAVQRRRQHTKDIFIANWRSDEQLNQMTELTFCTDACNADKDGGLESMPPQLRAADARPSTMWATEEGSPVWAIGVAKAAFLLENHPACMGMWA